MKIFGKKSAVTAVFGLAVGAVNGLLGAGGGMIAVPLLRKSGLEQKKAHANAVAVILPITVLSAGIYMYNGYVDIRSSLPYIPGGVVGALTGTFILKKISPIRLKKIFGCFMLYAGIRLLVK